MKLSMKMTLDGMVKALRLTAHGLAEDAEDAHLRAVRRNETALSLLEREARRQGREAGDEFGG